MQDIKISVVTVCLNAERTIEETVMSVCKQTYDNIEYIIIDGKSTDNTLSIINQYKDKIKCIVSEKDNGIYDAMNKGLKIATGDFLIFLGADDHFISFNTIQNVVPFLQNFETIYYGSVFRPIGNDLYCGYYNKYKLAIKNIPHQGMFFPYSIYKNYPYMLEYKVFADYYNNIVLFKKYSFEYIGETISFFNNSGISAISKDEEFDKIKGKIIIKHLGIFPFLCSYIYSCIRNLIKRL